MNIKNIIFDLDGTLIDSAPSILTTLAGALSYHGVQPRIILESSIIGPPLRETFIRLTGIEDSTLLDSLIDTFKSQYDAVGYKSTTIFPGVSELLNELLKRGIPIYIATNKRLNPTLLILQHFGWASHFRGVYALDCVEPPHLSKANMLTQALQDIGGSPRNILYVGDKHDDGLAADSNSLHFFKASWGYGVGEAGKIDMGWRELPLPGDLLARLEGKHTICHV
jgi:phosphoglycolate phosphatase